MNNEAYLVPNPAHSLPADKDRPRALYKLLSVRRPVPRGRHGAQHPQSRWHFPLRSELPGW